MRERYLQSFAPLTQGAKSTREGYYLGVDGGGTKTLAVLVNAQGNEIGRGLSGSANHAAVGLEKALHHIHNAVEQACQALPTRQMLNGTWFGVAGLDCQQDYERLYPHLRPIAHHIHLTNDAELALGALPQQQGVALIAGTGSIALGRNASGTEIRAGGWGHIIGDEGSGYDIGRQVLQKAARTADGREKATLLLNLVMQYCQVTKAEDIITWVYSENRKKADIARVTSCVFTAAEMGDPIARKILRQAARDLAHLVVTTSDRLGMSQTELPIAFGGGLLINQKAFRTQVIRHIKRHQPCLKPVLVDQPALSAARAAIHLFDNTSEHS